MTESLGELSGRAALRMRRWLLITVASASLSTEQGAFKEADEGSIRSTRSRTGVLKHKDSVPRPLKALPRHECATTSQRQRMTEDAGLNYGHRARMQDVLRVIEPLIDNVLGMR
jgi:hypothetical protein